LWNYDRLSCAYDFGCKDPVSYVLSLSTRAATSAAGSNNNAGLMTERYWVRYSWSDEVGLTNEYVPAAAY